QSLLLPDAPLARVQRGVDAAVANDTVHVAAGTYTGALTIGTTLTLSGANAGVDPCTGSRGPESVLMPDSGTATLAGTTLFVVVTADDVVIDGFEMNGDNPALTSPFTANGANPDADIAISSENFPLAGDRLVVRNDVIRNFFQFGIALGSTGGTARAGTVEQNRIENIPYWAGVVVYDDYYAGIERNCMVDVWRGVQTNNYYLPKPMGASATIADNVITTRTQAIAGDATYTDVTAILVNLHYQNASTWSVTDNTVTNLTPSSAGSTGIEVWSIQSAVGVTIEDNDATDFEHGYTLWNNPTSATITVVGGTVNGGTNGVVATNYDSFGDAASSSYAIQRVTIQSAASNGILVEDSASNGNGSTVSLEALNNVISGNGTGIRASGAGGDTTLEAHDNSITTSGLAAIANEGTTLADAICNWYGTSAGGPIAAAISGPVTFSPWLVSGTDSDLGTSGFQPAGGTCTGTPVFVVVNTVTHVICPGGTNGAIDITASGGTPPYSYLWSNAAVTEDLVGLAAGTYTVVVTDVNGSTATTSATVNDGAAAELRGALERDRQLLDPGAHAEPAGRHVVRPRRPLRHGHRDGPGREHGHVLDHLHGDRQHAALDLGLRLGAGPVAGSGLHQPLVARPDELGAGLRQLRRGHDHASTARGHRPRPGNHPGPDHGDRRQRQLHDVHDVGHGDRHQPAGHPHLRSGADALGRSGLHGDPPEPHGLRHRDRQLHGRHGHAVPGRGHRVAARRDARHLHGVRHELELLDVHGARHGRRHDAAGPRLPADRDGDHRRSA
ncbi:MAG: SprB repeat-containing protein, partial [Vicinamibacterales bacterium]